MNEHTLPASPGAKLVPELTVDTLFVVVEAGPDEGTSGELRSSSMHVGTAATCDLVLTDPQVSRSHVMFTVTPLGVLAEDLSSRNGTFVNGLRIRSVYVPDGALISLGQSQLRVRISLERFSLAPAAEDRCDALLGSSRAMRAVFGLVRQLARTDLPVAVTGETGTGKELVGRALHAAGPRRDKPFQVLDCGSIVKDLLRAELFGHERGAFTGADTARKGILEAAKGGTVFLDEVGEIDLGVQPQLLRALETREVQRLGSHQTVPVDVRIVSATNRDLAQMAIDGTFREDLYYRLSCVKIEIPPLRERFEDLPLLAASFLSACAGRHQLPVPALGAAALKGLEAHSWPGNVRELRNAMEALCVLADGRPIGLDLVKQVLASQAPRKPRPAPAAATPAVAPPTTPAVPQTLEELERTAIEAALLRTGWNRVQAAKALGISRSTLQDRIQRFGLVPPDGGAA